MVVRHLAAHKRRALGMQLRAARNFLEYRRVLTLLVLDKVHNVSEVSRLLHVGRRNIYRWLRWLRRNKSVRDALCDRRAYGGGPKRYTRKELMLLKKALKQTPQHYGYIETGWSVRLLRDYLAHEANIRISDSTLRRQLKMLNGVWTRFGYEFDPDLEREKKTPYSSYNQTLARTMDCAGRG